MTMAIQEIYDLMEGLPTGVWVAISTGERRVLAYGKDSQTVYAEAKQQGEEVPFIGRVPEPELQMFY